jgi:hypothetical protein
MIQEPDPMTPAQREAIQKAWDVLTEHFDHVLLVADWELKNESGDLADAHEGWWHGGSMAALGMCEFAKDRILHSGKSASEPE